MDDRKNEIKQANRKALPKFLLTLVIACIGGGVLGFCVACFGLDRMAGELSAAGTVFCRQAAPWLLVVRAVVQLAVCLGLWLVFTLTGMFLDTGFLPVLAVCVIWGVSTIVYGYWGVKLSRPGTPVR